MAAEKKKKAAVITVKDLRALDAEALVAKIAQFRQELAEQQRANAAGELPNPRAITNLRKQIAQALTVKAETAAAKKENNHDS